MGTVNKAVRLMTQSVPVMADWAPAVSGRSVEGMLRSRSMSNRGHAVYTT
jgi:hypothetical protein